MILQALLFVALLALALFSRRVRAYAVVLLLSVAATSASELAIVYLSPLSDDPLLFFKVPSYFDAFVFSAIAICMVSERVCWWMVVLCTISLITAAFGAWFWWSYYLGVSVDPYYVPVLQGLFLISVAVLAFVGGKDVFDRLGSFLAPLWNGAGSNAGAIWTRGMRVQKVQKEM